VIELVGSSAGIEYRPLPSDDPTQRQPDISRAKSTLGWAPRTQLREGLTATIAYFRAAQTTPTDG
jgi:UDP-glucuronate decarboxylase